MFCLSEGFFSLKYNLDPTALFFRSNTNPEMKVRSPGNEDDYD